MEVRRSLNGKRLWTAEQKRAILSELDQGFTPAEVARKHEIQLQHLYRWRQRFQDGGGVFCLAPGFFGMAPGFSFFIEQCAYLVYNNLGF